MRNVTQIWWAITRKKNGRREKCSIKRPSWGLYPLHYGKAKWVEGELGIVLTGKSRFGQIELRGAAF